MNQYKEGWELPNPFLNAEGKLVENPKEWEFWMKKVCTDENGQKYGWGRILDYIGIGWEDIPEQAVQMSIEDYQGRSEV